MPSILHVEDDDSIADLVQNTIGRQMRLFRARSAHEAQIAMALRHYDLALIRTHLPLATESRPGEQNLPQALRVNTNSADDPILTILNNLRRRPFVHQPAYC
jgi:DNA-binding response OmpR family regulator